MHSLLWVKRSCLQMEVGAAMDNSPFISKVRRILDRLMSKIDNATGDSSYDPGQTGVGDTSHPGHGADLWRDERWLIVHPKLGVRGSAGHTRARCRDDERALTGQAQLPKRS